MTQKELKDMIEELNGKMDKAGRGTEDWYKYWRAQAKALAQLKTIQRRNELHAWGLELELRRLHA